MNRMYAIAREASEQSNRISIPEISDLQTMQALLKKWAYKSLEELTTNN